MPRKSRRRESQDSTPGEYEGRDTGVTEQADLSMFSEAEGDGERISGKKG